MNQNNDNNNNDNTYLNVYFKKGSSKRFEIQCMISEKVSELINKYISKSGDKDKSNKYFLNAKQLSPDLTLAESGFINGAEITVISTRYIEGGWK